MSKENKKACFLAYLEGNIFLIPNELRDSFNDTAYFERDKQFYNYVFPEGVIMENILVDHMDLQALMDGDFE